MDPSVPKKWQSVDIESEADQLLLHQDQFSTKTDTLLTAKAKQLTKTNVCHTERWPKPGWDG